MLLHDRPGAYGTIPASWRDAGTTLLSKVSNAKLGEYLLGMDSLLRTPAECWPDDGVTWSVQVVEHGASKKHVGGHVFKVVLADSSPNHVSSNGDVELWAVDLSAKQSRQSMEAEFGKGKTLEQMLDPKNSSLAQIVLGVPAQLSGAIRRVQLAVRNTIKQQMKSKQGTFRRLETNATGACAAMALAMSAMKCEDEGKFAGIGPAPKHYNAVFGRPDEEKWVAAMDKEVIKIFGMGTWETVDTSTIPEICNVMNTCFLFKVKFDSEGITTERRARANADGRQQKPGTYGETFAPTSKSSIIRTICAITEQEKLTLYQFDIKGAFLMAPCKEPVYMNLPGTYRLPNGKALRCLKLLYGLKQSAYGFHEPNFDWLKDDGFKNLDSDGVAFMKEVKKTDGTTSEIILTTHVDDAIVATNDNQFYAEFLTKLGKDFELSDSGKLNWILGCKVEQNLKNGTVRMSQEKYCNNALKHFLSDANPVSTPCESNLHLQASAALRSANVTRKSYVTINRQLDRVCFLQSSLVIIVHLLSISVCTNLGPTYVAAIHRVLRYLAGNRSLGITYRRSAKTEANQLWATADADHAGADDRRSVSGWAVLMAGAMVNRASKSQPVTAISSTESQFYSVSLRSLDCGYLLRMMDMMGYKQRAATPIAQD